MRSRKTRKKKVIQELWDEIFWSEFWEIDIEEISELRYNFNDCRKEKKRGRFVGADLNPLWYHVTFLRFLRNGSWRWEEEEQSYRIEFFLFLFDWLKILIWNRRHTSIYIQERKRRGKRVWAKTRGPAHGPKHKIHISVIMKLKMLTCNEEKGLNDRIRLLIEFHLFFLVY